jgi:hypothetical protein
MHGSDNVMDQIPPFKSGRTNSYIIGNFRCAKCKLRLRLDSVVFGCQLFDRQVRQIGVNKAQLEKVAHPTYVN